jgi:hypothetical protein
MRTKEKHITKHKLRHRLTTVLAASASMIFVIAETAPKLRF